MSAKANKRKSLIAQKDPPSKNPKVQSKNTPAKPPQKQVVTPHSKRGAQVKGKGAKGRKVVAPPPQDSESENEDDDISDLDFDDGDSENDAEGIENEEDSDFDVNKKYESDNDEDEKEESDDDEGEMEESDDDEDEKVKSDDDEDGDDDENGSADEDQDSDEKGDLTTTKLNDNGKSVPKQKRYVVFVGNIPFNTTVDNIRDHFKAVGPISNVRIITHKDGRPKGFCFVDFKDSKSFEKSLSLNNSLLDGRRLIVEYSARNKNEKQVKEAKKKNFKLQALQKQGKLEGGLKENQKRRIRRAKAKKAKNQEDNSD